LLRDKFREFSRDTSGLGQDRVASVNASADGLISSGHRERAAVAEWKDALNEAWADLLELLDTRAQLLGASYELQRFYRDAAAALAQVRTKRSRLAQEVGRDLSGAQALERTHRAYENDVQALSAQVQQVQEDAARLAKAYAGPKAAEILQREQEVTQAWAELRAQSHQRRRLLRDTVEKFRFFCSVRDLLLWMDHVSLQIEGHERPR
ncbi:SPTN2 protein, partial [Brachypteracias leptosomus]|nr:SPTN2 protein [Brachypteracias leptosomus]